VSGLGYGVPARPGPNGRRTAQTRHAALNGSREEQLRRHLPLVHRIVQRLAARKPPHVELDDLISWGIVGLLDALGKYDPRKEAAFSTYAQFRIRGAILDHLRSLDWVPRSVRQKASLIEKVSHELEGKLGRSPAGSRARSAGRRPRRRWRARSASRSRTTRSWSAGSAT
jgi:RNA polymerase sigma factor (sigma-70 family)